MRKFKVTVNGQAYMVEVEEIAQHTAGAPAPAAKQAPAEKQAPVEKQAPARDAQNLGIEKESSDFKIVAPMPGTIIEIKVKEGDAVSEGAVILTLEAMKMENEITCPQAGIVSKILVKEGDAVNTGDPLVLFVSP